MDLDLIEQHNYTQLKNSVELNLTNMDLDP